jgi:hypothetical protein
MLDPLLQNALYAGMMAGASEIHQFVGVFDASEHDVASNDVLAAKGRAIMAAGAKWRGRLLSNVRAAGRLRFTLPMYDQLSATTQPRVNVYEITDQWRRGFDVAIGLCEGMSENGPGQQRVKQSLGQWDAKRGFDVGQRMQHERTLGAFRIWAASDSIGAAVKLQGLDGRPAIIAANPRAAAAVLDESERPDSETAGKLSEREQILRSIITNPYDHGAFR